MTTKPRVLTVDVGGTNVKIRTSSSEEMRKFPSARTLSATEMVAAVLKTTADWNFDCVTIGFPGLIRDGKPVREPLNLGAGWLDFDYERAFGKPTRLMNDAALQALAAYEGGRMLFLGFGTSIGCALVADGTLTTLEVGLIPLRKDLKFMDRLSKNSLRERGVKKWSRDVEIAVTLLRDVFWPDEIVIGGGNAKHLDPPPAKCRLVTNHEALHGAERLWPGADMLAEPYGSTWRITASAPLLQVQESGVR